MAGSIAGAMSAMLRFRRSTLLRPSEGLVPCPFWRFSSIRCAVPKSLPLTRAISFSQSSSMRFFTKPSIRFASKSWVALHRASWIRTLACSAASLPKNRVSRINSSASASATCMGSLLRLWHEQTFRLPWQDGQRRGTFSFMFPPCNIRLGCQRSTVGRVWSAKRLIQPCGYTHLGYSPLCTRGQVYLVLCSLCLDRRPFIPLEASTPYITANRIKGNAGGSDCQSVNLSVTEASCKPYRNVYPRPSSLQMGSVSLQVQVCLDNGGFGIRLCYAQIVNLGC